MTKKTPSGGRFLVIEDEALISMLFEQSIADLGGEVAGVAPTLETALTMIDTLAFDAAIVDVNLRGERSFPAIDKLMRRGAPFVLTTGYDAAETPERFASAPKLMKPFQLSELERMLKELLGQPGVSTAA